MARKDSAFRLAPPTSAPSISGCESRALAFFSLTLPPYRMGMASALEPPKRSRRMPRITACMALACSGVAVRQGLPDAQDRLDPGRLQGPQLGADEDVVLAEELPALGMAHDAGAH